MRLGYKSLRKKILIFKAAYVKYTAEKAGR